MTTTVSVLESDYPEVHRPYSQEELNDKHNRTFRTMRLGKIRAHHNRCNHFYFVKENGRKEKEITENNDCDSGNCSVCWKLSKTSRHLRSSGKDLIGRYMNDVDDRQKYEIKDYDFQFVEAERRFYTWLYQEEF
jgi:hypothetical protein